MPGGADGGEGLLGDAVHQRLRRGALRTEVDETSQQNARVEEDRQGHRLRSSSMSAATSTCRRASLGTVGRATSRRPTLINAARRDRLEPDAGFVRGHLDWRAGHEPQPLPYGRRDNDAACLVNGSAHTIMLPLAMASDRGAAVPCPF